MPQKDEKLLHDLIEKYAKLFAKLAYRYGVPIDDAEDVAMEAIWTFYKSDLYEIKDEVEVRKIMTTIVKHKSIDLFRKRKTSDVTNVELDDEEVYLQLEGSKLYEPETAVIANEGYNRIISTIEEMKPIWRDPVKLYFIEQRSYAEISEALGISEEVCRSRISRARKYLEVELKDMLK